MLVEKTALRRVMWPVCLVFGGALASPGCSSSSGSNATFDDAGADAGADGPPMVVHRTEAGASNDASNPGANSTDAPSGDGNGSPLYDGTVGKACQSNADCTPAGGPGLNTCSSSTFTNAIYPDAVCVLRMCDPGTDGNVHFCDGPDNQNSPGVCISTANGGICLPKCLIAADGSAPTGCPGKDTCSLAAIALANATQVVGIGFCFGGCAADADCPAGNKCQKDQGICATTVNPPTKALGQTCTSADNGSATVPAACSCLINSNTMATQGICSQTCVVGSTAAACPSGYVCDTFETAQVMNPTTGAPMTGFATQNTGLQGFCLPVAASCGGDAGACPTPTHCSTTDTVGPDCQP